MIISFNEYRKFIAESTDSVDLHAYDMYALYDRINKECFGGELARIPIVVKPLKSVTGKFNAKLKPVTREMYDMRITISNTNHMSEDKLRNVLCHEMIHFFVSKNYPRAQSHGYEFMSNLRRINSNGLGYNVSKTDDEDTELNTDLHKEYAEVLFAIGRHHIGVPYIVAPARTPIDKIVDLASATKVTELKVYKTKSPQIMKIVVPRGLKFKYMRPSYKYLLDNIVQDPTTVEITV